MTHDELVFEALSYRRNLGALLSDIRAYAQIREEKKHTIKDDRAVLRRLEDAGKVFRLGARWFLTREGYQAAKGNALRAEWEAADSWILLAILNSGGPDAGKLEHIIAAADFINHAIPTLEEMHGALNRLAAGGLIRARAGGYWPTDKARALLARVEAAVPKFVPDIHDGLSQILNCPCCGVQLRAVRWRIQLDRATLDDAYAKYSRSFGK